MLKYALILCFINFFNLLKADEDFNVIASNVKIILYSNSNGLVFDLSDFKSIYDDVEFNKTKPTILYIHGFTEDRNGYTTKRIVEAFEKRNDYNILSCDWGTFSKNFYFTSVLPKLFEVGIVVAKEIGEFFERGYSVCDFHLVGHSLGAQVSGLIGRTLKKNKKSHELCRITGLDPAGPGFYPETYANFKHISSKDAKFVDIIHTDGSMYGTIMKTGTADFYPNDGFTMPGCSVISGLLDPISSVCNHNRAVDYFAESVENPKAFIAVAAKSFRNFKKGSYDKNDVTFMGISCRRSASKTYYLQTNDQSPYGKACSGRHYSSTKPAQNFLHFIGEQVGSIIKTRKYLHRKGGSQHRRLFIDESLDEENCSSEET